MEIIPLNSDTQSLWADFCRRSDDAWFWHTPEWLQYLTAYGSSSLGTRPLGFALADSSGILAICPLFLEKKSADGEGPEFSSGGSGGYMTSPALRNDLSAGRREKIWREIFAHIDKLAHEFAAKRCRFKLTPVAPGSLNGRATYNYLTRYGYFDTSITSQIIDIELPLEQLWSDIRKGHRYDINRGEKAFRVEIFDEASITAPIFDQYRLLHIKAAGRETRPKETFDMMREWVAQGNGILCGAAREDDFFSFAYVNIYKTGAFYSSASDDPEAATDLPSSHVMQWHIIQWLKKHGFRWYELGGQQFGPLWHDAPSPKELSISFFKRGLGGSLVPLFRGEKYYSKEFLSVVGRDRLKRLAEARDRAGDKIVAQDSRF